MRSGETLLIFALVYTAIRVLVPRKPRPDANLLAPPRTWAVLAFAVVLGVLTFVVRLWFPFGWAFGPLNLQLCFFVQYVAMPVIILGTLAVRHVTIYPLLKFVVVSLVLVPLCFLLAAGIRHLPGARRIL